MAKVKREIVSLKRLNVGSEKYVKRMVRHEWVYHDWNNEAQNHVWNRGYFSLQKWIGFHDPSGGRKSE
jgi:hypothetical protein